MASTDPLADTLTQIRNALQRNFKQVAVPHSRLKESVVKILKQEGYLKDFKVVPDEALGEKRKTLHIYLKYGPDGEMIINKITRVSKPGRRVYRGVQNIGKVLDGLGVTVLSTSRGVISDRQARKLNIGGEILCRVW